MKRAFLVLLATAALAATSAATAAGGSAPSANVDSIATVTSDTSVVFDIDLYDCPPGNLIVVEFAANEPSRPDSGAAGGGSYGLSNGDHVQHLTVFTNSSSFLAGEQWVGSGTVFCGAIAIPVTGSGQAKSLNGV
jgi:hypothetical protein